MLDSQISDGELHPIDAVESVAAFNDWDFDRLTDDRIALSVTGQWRTYALTLAWSERDETLRLICTFEMRPPAHRHAELYDLLNRCNDQVWTGAFAFWPEQQLMIWRYGLLLSGGQIVGSEQIDRLILDALAACERYYPAFQMATWAEHPPEKALQVAIAEAYGRA